MFVSKAAVIGGGTMGGEIAQVIAAADIPVVVKDVDQEFVDHAIEKAREVTSGQLGRLVKKEKISQEQADQRLAEVMGRITGTVTYEELGDVDFVIEVLFQTSKDKNSLVRKSSLLSLDILHKKVPNDSVTYLKARHLLPFFYRCLSDKDAGVRASALLCIQNFGP